MMGFILLVGLSSMVIYLSLCLGAALCGVTVVELLKGPEEE